MAKGRLLLLDWRKVEQYTPIRCCHAWVSDESIRQAQLSGMFDDPMIPWNDKTHRAARIGTIATMMAAGVVFDPMRIYVGPNGLIDFKDGNHRLRAHQFNNDIAAISVWVTGRTTIFKNCLSEGTSWNTPNRLIWHRTHRAFVADASTANRTISVTAANASTQAAIAQALPTLARPCLATA